MDKKHVLKELPTFKDKNFDEIKALCDAHIPTQEERQSLLFGDDSDLKVYNLHRLLTNKETRNAWNMENIDDDYITFCKRYNRPIYNFDNYVRFSLCWLSRHSRYWLQWNVYDSRIFYLLARRLARQYKTLAEHKFLDYLLEWYPDSYYCNHRTLDTIFGIDYILYHNNSIVYLHIVEGTSNAFKLLSEKGKYNYRGYCRDKEKGIESQEYKEVRGFSDIMDLNISNHKFITFRMTGQDFIFDNMDLLYNNPISVSKLGDIGEYLEYYLDIAKKQDKLSFIPAKYDFVPVSELAMQQVA